MTDTSNQSPNSALLPNRRVMCPRCGKPPETLNPCSFCTPNYRLCAYDPCFDGAPCGDLGSYYVNGRYSCGHHLEAMIVRYAATNTVGHRWATVQVLTVENAPSTEMQAAMENERQNPPNEDEQMGAS